MKRTFLSAAWHKLASFARHPVFEPMMMLNVGKKVRVGSP